MRFSILSGNGLTGLRKELGSLGSGQMLGWEIEGSGEKSGG